MSDFKLGLQDRKAVVQPSTIDDAKRSVTVLFSTGAPVQRWTWEGVPYIEELAMAASNVRMERLNGGANLLDSHGSWSLRGVLGVTEKAWLDGGNAWATVRFSERAEVEPIWRDVRDGILRSVSVGYLVHKSERSFRDGMTVRRHVDWEPTEISLVSVPADAGAGIRGGAEATTVEVVEVNPEVNFGARNAARLRWINSRLRSGKK